MDALGAARRRSARASPRPCRHDRRRLQHRPAGGISARRAMAAHARRASATSASRPAITTPICAPACPVGARPQPVDERRRWRDRLSFPAPCATAWRSSACAAGCPTLPFVAAGRLGRDQIARLAEILRQTRDDMRVVLLHHPPVDGGGSIRNLADHRALGRNSGARRSGIRAARPQPFDFKKKPARAARPDSGAWDLLGVVDRPQSPPPRRLSSDRHRCWKSDG